MRASVQMMCVVIFLVLSAAPACGQQENPAPRVLFLSKSSAFEHSCIARKDGQPSHVEKLITGLAEEAGVVLTATKDGSLITAANLKNYDLVVFFTQGDLMVAGKDGETPMGETGIEDLLDWIRAGGAFMGYHCASDTFKSPKDGPVTPFISMVGGEFRAHGRQFKGTLKVVDPSHPTAASLPNDWSILEEWYLFRNLNKESIHVVALFDPGSEREKQKMYNIPSYPIIWCSAYGEGRVYYNAMGHREDVWDTEIFQQSIVDAAAWVLGQAPLQADPNYDEVVPSEGAAGGSE